MISMMSRSTPSIFFFSFVNRSCIQFDLWLDELFIHFLLLPFNILFHYSPLKLLFIQETELHTQCAYKCLCPMLDIFKLIGKLIRFSHNNSSFRLIDIHLPRTSHCFSFFWNWNEINIYNGLWKVCRVQIIGTYAGNDTEITDEPI